MPPVGFEPTISASERPEAIYVHMQKFPEYNMCIKKFFSLVFICFSRFLNSVCPYFPLLSNSLGWQFLVPFSTIFLLKYFKNGNLGGGVD